MKTSSEVIHKKICSETSLVTMVRTLTYNFFLCDTYLYISIWCIVIIRHVNIMYIDQIRLLNIFLLYIYDSFMLVDLKLFPCFIKKKYSVGHLPSSGMNTGLPLLCSLSYQSQQVKGHQTPTNYQGKTQKRKWKECKNQRMKKNDGQCWTSIALTHMHS